MPTSTLPTLIPLGSMQLSPDIVIQMIFLLLLAGYVIFSGVMYYHWQAYSTSASVGLRTALVYASITLPLLATLGFIALAI